MMGRTGETMTTNIMKATIMRKMPTMAKTEMRMNKVSEDD
jgi:hypothetical protein